MKLNTRYWLGVRHVGCASTPDLIEEVEFRVLPLKIAKFMITQSMARRFDICVARGRDEVLYQLNAKSNVGAGSRTQSDNTSIESELNALMAELGDNLED